jgi:hypothetical protein
MNARAPLFLFGQHLPFDGSSNRLRIILQKKKERRHPKILHRTRVRQKSVVRTMYRMYSMQNRPCWMDDGAHVLIRWGVRR